MNQKKLFEQWNETTSYLKALGEFVQNDFDTLLDDEFTTKEEIIESLKTFNDDGQRLELKIAKLRKTIVIEVIQFLKNI